MRSLRTILSLFTMLGLAAVVYDHDYSMVKATISYFALLAITYLPKRYSIYNTNNNQ